MRALDRVQHAVRLPARDRVETRAGEPSQQAGQLKLRLPVHQRPVSVGGQVERRPDVGAAAVGAE